MVKNETGRLGQTGLLWGWHLDMWCEVAGDGVHRGNFPYLLGTHFVLQHGSRSDPVEGHRPNKTPLLRSILSLGTIIITIFQMRKLKHRDVQELAQGHMVKSRNLSFLICKAASRNYLIVFCLTTMPVTQYLLLSQLFAPIKTHSAPPFSWQNINI